MTLVQFGAGNIGRSFVGALFSRAGWDVVFVDVDSWIVSLLNGAKYYPVIIKRDGKADETRRIGPVRAVDVKDPILVSYEIAEADMIAVSVGKRALPAVLPLIARGLRDRFKEDPKRPMDIIIAENARSAPDLCRTALAKELGPQYPLEQLVGLVETSIGKMVPIMEEKSLAQDPLQLFAEEYETLIVDKRGFRGPIPDIPGLCPVDAIAAYVDRKLFIHNLGHAAAAYLGYRADPSKRFIPEALRLPGVEAGVRKAMDEAADALVLAYPEAYSRQDLADHIEDLLGRFKNQALGDTVHRVGRDLPRKLSRDDRLVGAMLLCAQKKVPFTGIAAVYAAALDFAAPDEQGALYPADLRFRQELLPLGIEEILRRVSQLDSNAESDKPVIEALCKKAGA
jgi:mannitol-1-phosphate 5-dehydrogenase